MAKLFLISTILFIAGCVHCGPVCQEARSQKGAFITEDCKVTFNSRKCKEKASDAKATLEQPETSKASEEPAQE